MPLGLPLTVSASICLLALALVFTKHNLSVIVKTGAVLIAVGVFVVAVEVFISLYSYNAVRFVWSFYTLIPCVVLGVAAFVLEHRQNFKERVRRRLFY